MKIEDGASSSDQERWRILEERARNLAAPPEATGEEVKRLHLVTFSLGSERYGLEVEFVIDVQPLAALSWSRVPCTPDFIVGAVTIRGHIYSIMALATLLGLAHHPPTESAHVIVVESQGRGTPNRMECALLTGDVPDMRLVPVSALLPPPSASLAGQAKPFVSAVTSDMLIILDLERLLADPGIVVHEEV